MAQPRGIRNNNPGNLIKTDTQWLGEVAGTDTRFASFETPEHGIRAMARQLLTYQQRDGLTTVDQIIRKWAPPKENPSVVKGVYQTQVAAAAGLAPNDPIDLTDEATMNKVVAAMIKHENGLMPYTPEQIAGGIAMVPQKTGTTAVTHSDTSVATPPVKAELGEEYKSQVQSLWDRMNLPQAPAAPAVPEQTPTLTPANAGDVLGSLQAPEMQASQIDAIQRERQTEWASGVSWLDKLAASYDETTIPALSRSLNKPDSRRDSHFDVVSAYRNVQQFYQDPDEVTSLLAAPNQQVFDWTLNDIQRRRENAQSLATGTLAGTLSAGLVGGAGDPMTYVTGVGGMKAAALLGRAGASYYAVGGALGNLSYDAARRAAGADVSGSDFVAGALLGAGLGVVGYRLGGGASAEVAARYAASARAAAEGRARALTAARKELGEDATDAQVSAQADRIQRERLQRVADIVLAKPQDQNLLIPKAPQGTSPYQRVEPAQTRIPGEATPDTLRLGDDPTVTPDEFFERTGPVATAADNAAPGPRDVADEVLPPESGMLAGMRRVWNRVTGRPQEPVPDPDGLDFIPSNQVREAVRGILHQAQRGLELSPIDADRLRVLSEGLSESGFISAIRDNLGSTGVALMRSKSPVAQWWAQRALENTVGASRNSTAAIAKYQLEHMYMGDVKNQMDTLFHAWRREQGKGGAAREFFTNRDWNEFNRQVFALREGIRNGIRIVEQGESKFIKEASDLLTRQYDMMRQHQIRARVSGFGNLPADSAGYQPWAISPRKWRELSDAKKRAYVQSLSDEVQSRHGWDKDFSDYFARQYVDQVNKWMNNGVHASAVPQESAVGVLQKAMEARGMDEAMIRSRLDEFTKGGRGQTRGRLERNLLTPYDDGEGGYFNLMEIMETDQVALLQRQSRRVSGEVALANWGVTSDAEVQLIRTAIEHTGGTTKELEAFDQTVAELLGRPFKDAAPAFVDNLRAATSLVQLGGMGFAQLVETANAISTMGVTATLKKVPSFGRLYREVKALAHGQPLKGTFLEGMDEFVGGIGMHNYKNTWAHQMGDPTEAIYGRDSIGTIAKLIRGGQYLQGKLSLWRMIQAVQTRMTTEMAVNKGLMYVRDGVDTAALRDMGISPELAARVRADLPNVAGFAENNGVVMSFDPLKTADPQAMQEFVQAIMRGTSQIIQETYVGETGKWVHNGYLRFLTQFRTYSITSFEKQAVRQYRTHGALKAAGILLGAISVSAPIYILRTVLGGALLPADAWEEYKERRLSPESIGMAALGYTALGGWARDVMDMGGSIAGFDLPGSPRTPKGGVLSSTIPGLSLAEDAAAAVKSLVQEGDPSDTLRILPGGRLPFVAPIFQALQQ